MRSKGIIILILSALLSLSACSLEDLLTPSEDGEGSTETINASFTAEPTSGIAPLTVNFDASGSSTTGGEIKSYSWNFGDGENGEGKTVTHTYTKSGEFLVSLTVRNDNDESDVATATIVVEESQNDIYVDASYGGAKSDGSQQYPFRFITQAMEIATKGKIIHVLAGTYNESFRMKSGVTVEGTSADDVILIPSGENGITIEDLNSTAYISDITVKGAAGAGIYCGEDADVIISSCSFRFNEIGIYAYNNSNPTIENCSFYGNEKGMLFENNSAPQVIGTTIKNNSLGIVLSNNCSPQLINNNIYDNIGSGIICENHSNPTIDNNFIQNNKAIGIKIVSFSNPIISNNTVQSNEDFDLKCTDEYSDFDDGGGNNYDKCQGCSSCDGEGDILDVKGRYEGSGTKDDGRTVVRALEIEQSGASLYFKIFNQEDGKIPDTPNDSGYVKLKPGENEVTFTSDIKGDEWTVTFSSETTINATQVIAADGHVIEMILTKVD